MKKDEKIKFARLGPDPSGLSDQELFDFIDKIAKSDRAEAAKGWVRIPPYRFTEATEFYIQKKMQKHGCSRREALELIYDSLHLPYL